MTAITEFFKTELFVLFGFNVLVWHVLVAALVLIALIVIICVCVAKGKKKKLAATEEVAEQEPVADTEEPVKEEAVQEQSVAQAEEENKPETVAEQTQPEEEKKSGSVKVKVPVKKTVVKTTTNEPETKEEPEQKGEETVVEKKAVSKVYHITKRKDDEKWQVKLAKGARAIKLFNTQLEAIDFAKKLAENNEDARIIIHKEDGGFRKLTYKKK